MRTLMLLCGAMALAPNAFAAGREFPLEFKTLSAQDALSFPGVTGLSGSCQARKAAAIKREPAATSRHPLYGVLASPTTTDRFWYRLDESNGDGRGYDRLIIDLNLNGDLTDDPLITPAPGSSPPRTVAVSQRNLIFFGPIPAPNGHLIGTARPMCFAQFYLLTVVSSTLSRVAPSLVGQLQVKPGWYLEASVDLDGATQTIGIVDSDCNFRLGDVATPVTIGSGSGQYLTFRGGDMFLRNRGDVAGAEISLTRAEAQVFGPILYVGATPFKVSLSAGYKSLMLEDWSAPLAQLALPEGGTIDRLQVLWEGAPGRWQLLQPLVQGGLAKVPPGNFRLYTCTLRAKTPAGDALVLSGTKRSLKDTVSATAGATVPFKCGAPLEIRVTAERDTSAQASANGLLARLARGPGSAPAVQQRIQATVLGAGGETYSSFVLESGNKRGSPRPPTFTVTTADGKQVASGDLEYG